MRKPNHELQLIVNAPNAICVDCGGPRGEKVPFSLFVHKNGVLDIVYEGGSSWGITAISKWRYQNNNFYLIGMTESIFDTLSDNHWAITRDANISILKMIEKLHLPHNEKTLGCAISKKYKDIELSSYSSDYLFDNMPKCSNAEFP